MRPLGNYIQTKQSHHWTARSQVLTKNLCYYRVYWASIFIWRDCVTENEHDDDYDDDDYGDDIDEARMTMTVMIMLIVVKQKSNYFEYYMIRFNMLSAI